MAHRMQRFTQMARSVLRLAHAEAERMHHNYIGTEHLLLGLIREEGGIAGRVLRDLGLESARVKDMVERLTGFGRHAGGRIELAPATEQVLQMAIEEARKMGHHYIGTEHLLLGIIHQGEGVGLDVLRRLGITPEQVRRQTRRILHETPSRRASGRRMERREALEPPARRQSRAEARRPPIRSYSLRRHRKREEGWDSLLKALVFESREHSRAISVLHRHASTDLEMVLSKLEKLQGKLRQKADRKKLLQEAREMVEEAISMLEAVRSILSGIVSST